MKQALDDPAIQAKMAQLRYEFSNTKLILSVERLDYTKGILEKLEIDSLPYI